MNSISIRSVFRHSLSLLSKNNHFFAGSFLWFGFFNYCFVAAYEYVPLYPVIVALSLPVLYGAYLFFFAGYQKGIFMMHDGKKVSLNELIRGKAVFFRLLRLFVLLSLVFVGVFSVIGAFLLALLYIFQKMNFLTGYYIFIAVIGLLTILILSPVYALYSMIYYDYLEHVHHSFIQSYQRARQLLKGHIFTVIMYQVCIYGFFVMPWVMILLSVKLISLVYPIMDVVAYMKQYGMFFSNMVGLMALLMNAGMYKALVKHHEA